MAEQELPKHELPQVTPEVAANSGNRWMAAKRILGTAGIIAAGIGVGWIHMNLDAAQTADAHARRFAAYERCADEVFMTVGVDDKSVRIEEPFERVSKLEADCEVTRDSAGGVLLETADQYRKKARASAEAAVTANNPADRWKVGLVWTTLGVVAGGTYWRRLRQAENAKSASAQE